MKAYRMGIVLAAVILLAVVSASLFYSNYVVLEVRNIPVRISVGETPFLNTKTDLPLDFGKTKPAGSSSRHTNITNTYGFPVRVSLVPGGDIWEWISFSEDSFTIGTGETRRVTTQITVPEGEPYGDYTGFVDILIRRGF
jgi:hypothetical protein